jgi:hypothetical protein
MLLGFTLTAPIALESALSFASYPGLSTTGYNLRGSTVCERGAFKERLLHPLTDFEFAHFVFPCVASCKSEMGESNNDVLGWRQQIHHFP